MPILSNIPFGSGHLENASITGKRGIFRDVSLLNWILRLKIYKHGDFHEKNMKTLTPNECLKSALDYCFKSDHTNFSRLINSNILQRSIIIM